MHERNKRPRIALGFALALLVAAPAAGLSSTPQELFERAETLYRQLEVVDPAGRESSWLLVADAFNDVVARYPDSPLASEALWRMSWIYGRQGRAGDEAAAQRQLLIYRDLVQRYPSSPHAPEALLRLAVGAEDEGGARAASLYARLLQQYPGTPQASLARNRLAEVRRANPALAEVVDASPKADSGAAASARPRRDKTPPPPEREEPPPSAELAADLAGLAMLTGVRHYSDKTHTRVVLDLDRAVSYSTGEAKTPARLFIDLQGVEKPELLDGAKVAGREQVIPIAGGAVSQLRVGLNRPGVVRVVMDFAGDPRYTLFTLDRDNEPYRIVIDVPTATVASRVNDSRRPPETRGDSITQQLGLGVRRIVLDPGHGGTDPGAIGRTGVTEKQITLELSKALASRLRASGYEVQLTRETDTTVSLEDRTAVANRVDADLFISVHVNSARNRKLRGFETYYLNLANDPTAAETAARENAAGGGSLGDLSETLEQIVKNEFQSESGSLARSIQDSLVMQVSKNYQNVRDLGVKTAPFFVLVGAEMPAVLIEASFVSNEEEEAWLKSSAYRSSVAEAIEIGLQSYVDERRMASGRQNYRQDSGHGRRQ